MSDPTPAEYVASLRGERGKIPVDGANIRQALKERFDLTDAEIEAALSDFGAEDYAERLLGILRPRLPANVLAKIDDGRIATGEIEKPTVELYAVPLRAGHAILIHTGAHRFIYRVARILATRITSDETEAAVAFEDTARIMADTFWWYQETGESAGPDYPVDSHQLEFANLLTIESMGFLLCHELAHAVIDQEAGEAYLAEVAASRHLDEHGADVLGALFALGVGSPQASRSSNDMALSYAGIEFALQIYATLERLGFDASESHPPSSERLAIIREAMQERCGDQASWATLTSLSSAIERLFTNIERIIANPAEHEAFFERQARGVVDELNEALSACVGGFVPDYSSFYELAGPIFSRGYSHRILERVAEVATEFTQILENPSEIPELERALRFQKLKLLFGFINQHLHEPARSLLGSALRPAS